MKTTVFLSRCFAAVALSFVLAIGLSFASAASVPASSATTMPSSAAAQDQVQSLLSKSLEQALAGRFEESLATISSAAKLAPRDQRIIAAKSLLGNYVEYCTKMEAERSAEYAATVQRVGWSVMTQKYQQKLAATGAGKKLRDKAKEVIVAASKAGNSDNMEDGIKDGPELKSKSIKSYDEAIAALAEAVKCLPDSDSEYVKVFKKMAKSLGGRIEACKKVWQKVNIDDVASRKAGAKELKTLEDDLSDDLADLDLLTSDKPWREGLFRARLAKQIASPKDKMTQQDWYVSLIKDNEVRGKDFIGKAEWNDALMVYACLEDLDDANETYQNAVKQVRRHFRVLRLYGKEPASGPAAESKPASEAEPLWQELVEGVDTDMVEKAISQLDGYYVTALDYRKVTRGALLAVKVLAETPQVAATFPGLADKAKKDAFIKDIDAQLQALDSRDRVDHLDLTLAMNNVLRASERTVGIPTEVLVVEFTDGFLDEMDEFSTMIWPHDVSDFEKQTMGHFGGVGIQITKEPGEPLKVVTPLAGSPALKAGIKAGDFVLAVDGRPTDDVNIDKLVRMISGEKGTKVVLRIKRAGREPFNVTLTREEISISTVRGWQRKPDGQWDYTINGDVKVGYIRITQFTDQTPGEFDQALAKLAKEGVKSLVVDVRSNPGGLMRSATDVADEFLRSGRLVSTEGRQTRRSEINATADGKYLDGDLVVLINQVSASAAEILSGALKDWNRATILGTRTFGKGSVQNVIPIRRQRAVLKLTTAYYYLPSGRLLHKKNGQKDWGVDPDVEVRITPKQMRRWFDIRSKTDLIQDVDPAEQADEMKKQYDSDAQLAAAVLILRLKQLQEGHLPTPVTAAAGTEIN